MHWGVWCELEGTDIDSMFSTLVHNARYTQELSIRCGWIWTAARLDAFAKALKEFHALSSLHLLLPLGLDQEIGGEYAPLLRLLAEKGRHLQLLYLTVEHVARPNSPIFEFLTTQHRLISLQNLSTTVGRVNSIPDPFLPKLETLDTNSEWLVAALVPNRPISTLLVRGAAARPSFLDALDRSLGKSLDLTVAPREGVEVCSGTSVESIRRLANTPAKVTDLRLEACLFDWQSHYGLEKLTSLKNLTFWDFQGSEGDLKTWVEGLPPSVQAINTIFGRFSGHRYPNGYDISPSICQSTLF